MPTAYLTLGGATIPVAAGSLKVSYSEIGNIDRAYGGTLRASVIRQVTSYSFTTVPLSVAAAASFVSAYHGATLTMSGDCIAGGSQSVRGTVTDATDTRAGPGLRRVLSVTLTLI